MVTKSLRPGTFSSNPTAGSACWSLRNQRRKTGELTPATVALTKLQQSWTSKVMNACRPPDPYITAESTSLKPHLYLDWCSPRSPFFIFMSSTFALSVLTPHDPNITFRIHNILHNNSLLAPCFRFWLSFFAPSVRCNTPTYCMPSCLCLSPSSPWHPFSHTDWASLWFCSKHDSELPQSATLRLSARCTA